MDQSTSWPPEGMRTAPASAIDVRVVLFAIQQSELWVALEHSDTHWRLPCVTLSACETLDAAAMRALADVPGATMRYLEQLYTLANAGAAAPAVIVAYLGIAEPVGPGEGLAPAGWHVAMSLPKLANTDAMIVDYALVRLRAKLGYTTIAFHLLPLTFSLSELQQVYEIVLDRQLDKRNFRRRIQSADILEATHETRREGSHRPARLFRFRAAHDADTYLTPVWVAAQGGEIGKT